MLVSKPKYRRPVSSNQDLLLWLLFKFRFVSTDLLAEFLGKDRSTVYESLYVLEQQGYVHKIYDSTYRLRQIPARYTLASEGIKHLLAKGSGNPSQLRYFYRNRSAKPEHIEHSLAVLSVFVRIKQQTSKRFAVYSGSEIAGDSDYIRPLPDLVLERRTKHDEKPNLLILEVIDPNKPFWFYRSRLKAHQKHFDDNWKYDDYPTILLIAPDYRTERYMLAMVARRGFDFDVWVTHKKRLNETKDSKVWATEFEDEEYMEYDAL